MANNRKARTGLLKSRGILGKMFPADKTQEPSSDGKRSKDRTAAHKKPANWKKVKKEKRRAYNKARRSR